MALTLATSLSRMIAQFGVNMNIYTRTDPAACLLAFDFETGSGTTAVDRSGNGNNGTLTNAVFSTTQKKQSHSTYYDGTGDYVDGTVTPQITNTAGAISVWIYPTASSGSRGIVRLSNVNKPLIWQTATNFKVTWSDSSGLPVGGNATNQFALNINAWNHLVFTWENGEYWLYHDTVEKENVSGCTFAAIPDTNFRIGSYSGGDFQGYIDNVQIYNRKLEASDVADMYGAPGVTVSGFYGDGQVSYQDQGAEKVLISEDLTFFDQTEGGPHTEERYRIYLLSTTNLGADDRVVHGGNTYDCKDLQPLKLPDGTVIAYTAIIEKLP